MIKINVIKNGDRITTITIKGHANYEEYGKDIVCAAVSATYLCTINGILSLKENSIEVLSNHNTEIINILDNNDITNKLLQNMIRCLKSLEKKYPNNIKIK